MPEISTVNQGKHGQSVNLARDLIGGKSTPVPIRVRTLSPSEFAGELSERGVIRCERWVQVCCRLPVGNPRRIKTMPGFAGRHLIPETELFRLLAMPSEVSA
jgi:hypothetical protein